MYIDPLLWPLPEPLTMGLRVLCSNYNYIHVYFTAILQLLSVTQNTIIIKKISVLKYFPSQKVSMEAPHKRLPVLPNQFHKLQSYFRMKYFIIILCKD